MRRAIRGGAGRGVNTLELSTKKVLSPDRNATATTHRPPVFFPASRKKTAPLNPARCTVRDPFEDRPEEDVLPVRDGVVAVPVDGELLLLDRNAGMVFCLNAGAMDALGSQGEDRSEVLAALAGFGVVDGQTPAPDRRDVLRAAGLGITVLALPGAAAAVSAELAGQEAFALSSGAVSSLNPSASSFVTALLVQSDGKIVLGGAFTSVSGTPRSRIARLHPNGQLDANFNPSASSNVLALALHSDGRIVLGGQFTSVGGTTRNRLARVHPNGTVDESLDQDLESNVSAIAIQNVGSEEHIVVGGVFVNVGTTRVKRLIRVRPDNTRDPVWDNIGGQLEVRSLAVDEEGGVIVGGVFQNIFNEANVLLTRGGVFRVTPDSTVDTDFAFLAPNVANTAPTFSTVDAVAIDQQGRILIGGRFQTSFANGGPARSFLARINADGTPDEDFAPVLNGNVASIAIQSDGRAVVGGGFTSIDGQTRNRIARLHADTAGQSFLDTTFDPNASGMVSALAVQSNGRIVLGGSFTTVGGETRNRIARLD